MARHGRHFLLMEPYIWNSASGVLTVYYDQATDDWREKAELARTELGFPPEKIVTEICIPENLRRKMPPYHRNQK